MEQISFDYLDENAGYLEKEQLVYDIIRPILVDTLANDSLTPDCIFFRAGNAENSQYSSVYLFNEGCIFCRICFRGKQHYLSLPSKYEKCIPEGTVYKILSYDPGYCRIPLESVGEVRNYEGLLSEILAAQIDTFPSEFGCCSRYEACSDALKCV